LILFAMKYYPDEDEIHAAYRAISIILFKVEGQLIKRHPEYQMDWQLYLDKIDRVNHTVEIQGVSYPLKEMQLDTVSIEDPYQLIPEEAEILRDLKQDFMDSLRLDRHIAFLYEKGSMYKIYNGNLLFHGCVPMDDQGNFVDITVEGATMQGKHFYDYADHLARRAYYDGSNPDDIDFMWFLWGAEKSPLCGRRLGTFASMYVEDPRARVEVKNPYYELYFQERICNRILREFGLFRPDAHIINGHTPVHAREGEKPVRANGKLLVIDGGFCRKMNKTTGIAGYTLIYNSHGLRIKSHHPFVGVEQVLENDGDIASDSELVELCKQRVMVRDTDIGRGLQEDIKDLKQLLANW